MGSPGSLRLVVFDLDGTLIDGYAAIADALSHALGCLGLPPRPLSEVRGMVGHGLERLVEECVGTHLVAEGVRHFRERYPEVAVEKTDLLDGVPEVLEELSRRGLAMAHASNKPARFSRMILEAKGISRFFSSIEGPGTGMPAKPHPAMLESAMRHAASDAGATLAVGDMEVDSEFARAAGCAVVLIPKGSRTRRELEAVSSDALLENLRELPAWIDSRRRIED
jgi:phosphoglycolate phosphatase